MPTDPERDAEDGPGLLAGVDEAGLGPILGPLVVAGVAMAGPKGADPWELLASRISRERYRKGSLRVADSKKVHSGKYGFARLEETVLSFWGAHHGRLPVDLGELLSDCGADVEALSECPWYGDLDLPLPHAGDRDVLELSAHTLAHTMSDAGIEILRMAIRPMDVAEFNASIARTDNKSETHFEAYADVIGRMLAALPGDAHLVADRCGGRVHYAAALRRRLKPKGVATLKEEYSLSTYEILLDDTESASDGREAGGTKKVQVSFAAGGEERAFPTALASCCAKYLRELMMARLNAWFADRVPDLKRTAGYYVDGNRFLQDVGAVLEDPDFPVTHLVRAR